MCPLLVLWAAFLSSKKHSWSPAWQEIQLRDWAHSGVSGCKGRRPALPQTWPLTSSGPALACQKAEVLDEGPIEFIARLLEMWACVFWRDPSKTQLSDCFESPSVQALGTDVRHCEQQPRLPPGHLPWSSPRQPARPAALVQASRARRWSPAPLSPSSFSSLRGWVVLEAPQPPLL